MKCYQCGLVNFRSATHCKRCGVGLENAPAPASDDSGDVWRDSNHLVLTSASRIPGKCMTCNSSEGIQKKLLTVGYLPKVNLVLLLIGFLYYKKVKVPIGLCEEHQASGKKHLLIAALLIIGSIFAFIIGLACYSLFFMVAFVILMAAGMILGTIKGQPVAVEKLERPYMWVKGPSREYLAALPVWRAR